MVRRQGENTHRVKVATSWGVVFTGERNEDDFTLRAIFLRNIRHRDGDLCQDSSCQKTPICYSVFCLCSAQNQADLNEMANSCKEVKVTS